MRKQSLVKRKEQKAIRCGKIRFLELEQKPCDEFIQKRNKGRIIKKWWFMSRAKQIVRSEYDDEGTNFKFSNNWFLGFRKCHRISFRKKLMFLRNLLHNYENLSRTFKGHSLLGTMGHTS